MFNFAVFRKSIDGLAGEIQQLRQEIETKKQLREDLMTLPLSREDLAEAVSDWIDESSKVYLQGLPRSLAHLVTSPMEDVQTRSHIALLDVDTHGQTNRVMQPPLLYLLAPQIKEGITRAIAEMDYPEVTGPPRAERLAEIEKLDAAIVKLEESEATLVSQADGAGISIGALSQPRRKGQ